MVLPWRYTPQTGCWLVSRMTFYILFRIGNHNLKPFICDYLQPACGGVDRTTTLFGMTGLQLLESRCRMRGSFSLSHMFTKGCLFTYGFSERASYSAADSAWGAVKGELGREVDVWDAAFRYGSFGKPTIFQGMPGSGAGSQTDA